MHKIFAAFTAAVIGVAMGTASLGTPPPEAKSAVAAPVPLTCPQAGRAATTGAPSMGSGVGLWSSVAGQVVGPAGPAQLQVPARAASGGVARHVTAVPGVGVTFALDRPGGDVVIAAIGQRTLSIPQTAEVLHPTLSASGALAWSAGSSIRVKGSPASPIRQFGVPVPGSTTFSPVYLGRHALAAVLSSAVGRTPEGADRNDLYRIDLRSGRWRPMTRFRAAGDHWVAIRTPVATSNGGVEFIRITADASETVEPRFELWEVTAAGRVRRIETLDREMYLAGRSPDGHRIWNVPAAKTGASAIMKDLGAGNLIQIGCGAVLTDPRDTSDPDRRAGVVPRVPPRTSWPDLAEAPSAGAPISEVAIIVGDYAERSGAESAAASIRTAYPASTVEVVDNQATPLAIKPGVWGALLRLPADADPTQALAEFREKLPSYQTTSWVVTP